MITDEKRLYMNKSCSETAKLIVIPSTPTEAFNIRPRSQVHRLCTHVPSKSPCVCECITMYQCMFVCVHQQTSIVVGNSREIGYTTNVHTDMGVRRRGKA